MANKLEAIANQRENNRNTEEEMENQWETVVTQRKHREI